MLKSIIYSVRYMVLIVIFYYIFQLKIIYAPNILMIAIIPVNFLAIHYGILYQIEKDHYVTKYYILMSLILLTTLFNLLFLSFNNINMVVVVFTIFVNALELIYLDLPSSSKVKISIKKKLEKSKLINKKKS